MLLKILWRNALRHRLRTSLTVAGMVVAILSFGLLRTVIDAWYAGVAASAANRLVTRNAISLIFPLPLSYAAQIRAVDGVRLVALGNWFGAYYQDPKNFFANFAVSADSYLAMYPELIFPEADKAAFMRDRKGAAVGAKLATRFGWKLGQTVVLTGTIFPGNWEFTLRAIYKGRDRTVDETMFILHWDYLNETMKEQSPHRADQVGFFMIEVNDPTRAAGIAQAIDARFANSRAETLTETEKAFQLGFVAMSEAIILAIRAVSFVVIAIILAVVANTMAMSVRERRREYAVLKTLGFTGTQIAGLIFGESLVITALGGALGIALTFPAAQAFKAAVGQFFPIFNVSRETIIMDAAVSLTVGLLAAAAPAYTAARVRVAQALRKLG